MDIKKNIEAIVSQIPKEVCLVAVSKTKPNNLLEAAYTEGVRDFGENKVQELCSKAEALPKDIKWHFIGHLQRNKVKYLVDFVHLIHSVDSVRLLKEIEKRAKAANKKVKVLLQFHIASEDTKFGFSLDEFTEFAAEMPLERFDFVEICGVMGMATFTDDKMVVRSEFKQLAAIFKALKSQYFSQQHSFHIISMGMSNDYQIAIEEGSNLIRIGSDIFGARNTH